MVILCLLSKEGKLFETLHGLIFVVVWHARKECQHCGFFVFVQKPVCVLFLQWSRALVFEKLACEVYIVYSIQSFCTCVRSVSGGFFHSMWPDLFFQKKSVSPQSSRIFRRNFSDWQIIFLFFQKGTTLWSAEGILSRHKKSLQKYNVRKKISGKTDKILKNSDKYLILIPMFVTNNIKLPLPRVDAGYDFDPSLRGGSLRGNWSRGVSSWLMLTS